MSASTEFVIRMNSENDANRAVSIIKEVASKRVPEYPTEIDRFVNGIKVNSNNVELLENYSLTCNSFCEWIPQIMMEIARWDFGTITMEAWHFSESCGYVGHFEGRVFKNGKFRMSFSQHD